MIYFLLIYSLFFIALTWFRPRWALFLFLAVLPSYQIRFQILNMPLTLLEIMILILFVVYLLRNVREVFKIWERIGSWKWLILFWLILASMAVFIAPDLQTAAGIWKAYFIEPILLLIIFLSLIKTKKDLNLALGALIFSGFYISIYTIGQKFLGGGVWSTEVWGQPKIWRATGLFPHPNFLGLYLGPIILLGLGQIIANFRKNKWFIIYTLLFIVLLPLAIILARSEGAILGVLAGLVFWGLIYAPARKWTIISLVILFLVVAGWPGARNYVLEKGTLSDLSGQLRINIWSGAVSLIKDNPVLGVGLSGYQKLIPDYQKRFYHPETKELISVETHPYPHNLFLAFWLELGLLGLIVFCWILIKFFVQGFRKIYGSKSTVIYGSIMASMIVILTHGLVDTPYLKNDLAVLFWIIIGLILVLESDKIEFKI